MPQGSMDMDEMMGYYHTVEKKRRRIKKHTPSEKRKPQCRRDIINI